MSVGLVPSGGRNFSFRWLGQQVMNWVEDKVDSRLHAIGNRVVDRAQQLAPVDTGALRDSIGYVVAGEGLRRTLSIQVGMPYGIYQEFGTRNIPPRPYIRPALLEAGRLWGIDLQMAFAHGGPSTWQGIYHTRGQYVIPTDIQPKPLTNRQVEHVRSKLMPSGRALHRGNVKRARMTVRHSF